MSLGSKEDIIPHMGELPSRETSRILTREQAVILSMKVLNDIKDEPWKDAAYVNFIAVDKFITEGIRTIRGLEITTYQRHPEVHTDTDIVYIDSGPGPYSYNMLESGKTEVEDTQYHKWPWSRKMDRARIKAAYALTAMVTAKRIEEATGVSKPAGKLTPEDFQKYGPFLMYASAPWQNSHVRHVLELERKAGIFLIPDDKLIMYGKFTNRRGDEKPIVSTADQIEGLHFPPFEEKSPPRRIVIVSHPAHLLRIVHLLGKYPDSIPNGTVLQLFPIPTPKSAGNEYSEAELLGTLAYVFKKNRATLAPYHNYEI